MERVAISNGRPVGGRRAYIDRLITEDKRRGLHAHTIVGLNRCIRPLNENFGDDAGAPQRDLLDNADFKAMKQDGRAFSDASCRKFDIGSAAMRSPTGNGRE